MASGSSGRNNPNSKGFDFASSDDILCSYEDYDNNQDTSNGSHSDPVLSSNSTKEFHKSRMVRSSMFPAPACSPQEEPSRQDVIVTVEKTMKKHTDNLMRFLEGISSRLSQLELYCYNLDKSIGELRSDLIRDHGESDSKLRSVEKHLQEVHRSVQILRDKQELAETQKELAKMHLAQKESSSANEHRASVPSSDQKPADNTSDGHGQELALVLPNQVTAQGPLPTRPVVQQQTVAPTPPQAGTQSQAYYLPPAAAQMPNQQAPVQPQQAQTPYLPADAQYRTPQMQEISRVSPQPAQTQVNQGPPHVHPSNQYQQHWPQQPQMRPPPSSGPFPPYLPSQLPNPSQQEIQPNSLQMQAPYSGISQQGSSRAEQMPYGYGGLGQAVQQQQQQQPPPPQHLKSNFGVQPNVGYSGSGNPYVMYEGEAGQSNHPPQQPHFPQGGYPPSSVPPRAPQPLAGSHMARPPQFARGHPYGELIDKLVSMGYRGDHVASVIQRLEETGQPVDFNSVLDKLNGLSSGGGQRGWSG